jgi:hypothetical protein
MQFRVRYKLPNSAFLYANYDAVPADENLYSCILGLGIGAEVRFKRVFVFGSTRIGIPSGYKSEYANEASTPITAILSVGLRVKFKDLIGMP